MILRRDMFDSSQKLLNIKEFICKGLSFQLCIKDYEELTIFAKNSVTLSQEVSRRNWSLLRSRFVPSTSSISFISVPQFIWQFIVKPSGDCSWHIQYSCRNHFAFHVSYTPNNIPSLWVQVSNRSFYSHVLGTVLLLQLAS